VAADLIVSRLYKTHHQSAMITNSSFQGIAHGRWLIKTLTYFSAKQRSKNLSKVHNWGEVLKKAFALTTIIEHTCFLPLN